MIIEPFDLFNIILLTRTRTLVNNLLMNKFQRKSSLEHMLPTTEKTANPAKSCARKILRTQKNFTYTRLLPQIYQKFTSWKTQRKYVNQLYNSYIAIEQAEKVTSKISVPALYLLKLFRFTSSVSLVVKENCGKT